MKRYIALAFIFGISVGIAGAFEMQIDPTYTGSVAVSTSVNSPTQLFVSDLSAMRTYVVNTSTNVVYIVGMSTTAANPVTTPSLFSISLTTGSFYIPAAVGISSPTWSPDGPIDPFRGPLWAVANSQGGTVIQRFRAK